MNILKRRRLNFCKIYHLENLNREMTVLRLESMEISTAKIPLILNRYFFRLIMQIYICLFCLDFSPQLKMNDEMNGTYLVNESNCSVSNNTDNSTLPAIYALGPPLATISSTCIIVGTFFSIICIYRYLRRPNLRTYFTYIVSQFSI